jgi:hypothetical protein
MADKRDRTGRSQAEEAEAERYRVAAEAALEQLDWCIAYLHRIRKPAIAAALARNRAEIGRRMQ